MSLFEKISQDLMQAQKKGEQIRLNTLRMLKSDLKYKQIDKSSPLTEEDEIAVLASAVKKHRDSIEEFKKGKREDLVAKEEAELAIILEYLPKQFSPEELADLIEQAISESGAITKAEVGKVMKILMPKVKGRADGKLVNSQVLAKLS